MNESLNNLAHCPTCQISLIEKANEYYVCNSKCALKFKYLPPSSFLISKHSTVIAEVENPPKDSSFLIYYYFNLPHSQDYTSIYAISNSHEDQERVKAIYSDNILTYQDFTDPIILLNKINLLLTF